MPLGDLAEFRNGVNYTKANFGRGIKVINVKDFQDRLFPCFSELGEIDPSGVVDDDDLLRERDILFVRSNGNRDLIGRTLFMRGMTEPVTHSAFTIRARIRPKRGHARFYAYLFRSTTIRDVLSAHGGGTNISNLSQGLLARLPVPIPPLVTQARIASVLSAYDDLIENNARRIAILEEMARALYREWFIHFRFPGHEKARMVDSPLGRIPEGWEVRYIRDVAQVNAHTLDPAEAPAEILYVDIASVSPGRIDRIEPVRFNRAPGRARRKVKDGDILWSTVRPNRRSFALVLNPPANLIVSTGFAVITPKLLPFSLLYFLVTGEDFVAYLTNRATGAAYPAVHQADFEEAQILIPASEPATTFHGVASPLLMLSEVFRQNNLKLRAARDLLLPKLISGEIDVSELDPPAAAHRA